MVVDTPPHLCNNFVQLTLVSIRCIRIVWGDVKLTQGIDKSVGLRGKIHFEVQINEDGGIVVGTCSFEADTDDTKGGGVQAWEIPSEG
jgi:hypothetical protein